MCSRTTAGKAFLVLFKSKCVVGYQRFERIEALNTLTVIVIWCMMQSWIVKKNFSRFTQGAHGYYYSRAAYR